MSDQPNLVQPSKSLNKTRIRETVIILKDFSRIRKEDIRNRERWLMFVVAIQFQ